MTCVIILGSHLLTVLVIKAGDLCCFHASCGDVCTLPGRCIYCKN